MASPRIDQINVVVPDLVAAAGFLADLGIELEDVPPGWDAHHRAVPSLTSAQGHSGDEQAFGIDLDSSTFAVEWGGLDPSFTGVVLNLRVDQRDDVDQLHDTAQHHGGTSKKAPYDAFWGSRYAIVEGPGPIVVGIMSEPDGERRTRPPAIEDFT